MSKPVWVLPSLFLFIAAIVTVASAQQNDAPIKHAAPIKALHQLPPLLPLTTIPPLILWLLGVLTRSITKPGG